MAVARNFRALSRFVRERDYDAFVTGIFAPSAAAKEGYFAVHALALELASVRSSVRGNVAAGRMRVQWWRSLIDEAYQGQPPPHLVGASLAASCGAGGLQLTRGFLMRMCDARDEELEQPGPATLQALEARAEALGASRLYLSLECFGVRDLDAEHVASHVGKAAHLAALLRDTRALAAEGLVALPADALNSHGARPDDVLAAMEGDEAAAERLLPVFYDVAVLAHQHAEHARELAADLPPAAAAALLVAQPTWRYLQALQEANFNVFGVEPESPLAKVWRGWRGSRSGGL